jgi:hypothetical protein
MGAVRRASTVAVEIAHLGVDGALHGHSLTIEAWTDQPVDLDAWRARLGDVATTIEGQIERTVGGRTFEDVAEAVLNALPDCVRVVVRLPTRGHIVEATR